MASLSFPLVWKQNTKFKNVHEAQGYDVQQNGNSSWSVKPLGANRIREEQLQKDFPTIEDAQRAAQQHADECLLARMSPEAREWLAIGINQLLDVRDPDHERLAKLAGANPS